MNGMGYRKVDVGEKTLDEFPGLTAAELEAVNDMYDHYLFYKKSGSGRVVSSTCCHQHEYYVGTNKELVTPEDWQMLCMRHGESMLCPFCGRPVTVQNIGTARTCTGLKRFIPVVFLSTSADGGTVYAQCYWSLKDYNCNYAAEPRYAVTRVYRFRRGEALQWEERWASNDKTRMQLMARPFIASPFELDSDNRGGYRVLGIECLEHSFLRYTQYQRWEQHSSAEGLYKSLVRYLGLASLYPESVEMLMKADVVAPIKDYVFGRIKNSAVLRWGEKDPRKALGLSKVELREFLGTSKEMETLYILRAYRRAGMAISMDEATRAVSDLRSSCKRPRDTAAVCAAAGVKPDRLTRYLNQYTGGCHAGGYRSLSGILYHWWDNIDAAEKLGYDMKNRGVLMPRDLQESHDNATALLRRRIEDERAREEAERDKERRKQLRLAKKAYDKRLEALRARYAFAISGYSILLPESADEIIAEGKALEHCVAGYAERHMAGKVTILFLRRDDALDVPLVTIEMKGSNLMQMHGFRNDNTACESNPNKVAARVLYAKIIDPWLAWVAAGSKRDKQGQPVLPKARKDGKRVA